MTSLKISKNSIIPIEKFLTHYYEVEYDGEEKLTHKNMQLFLYRKGIYEIKKINFNNVKKNLIINGTYIAVKDNNNQIIIYKNPKSCVFDSLLDELRSYENLKKTEQIRREILKEMKIKEAKHGLVSMEELEENYLLENPNRQKVLCRGFKKNYQKNR